MVKSVSGWAAIRCSNREILRKEGIDLPDRSLFLDMGRWRVAVYDLTGMKGLGLIPAVGISLVVVQYKGVG